MHNMIDGLLEYFRASKRVVIRSNRSTSTMSSMTFVKISKCGSTRVTLRSQPTISRV